MAEVSISVKNSDTKAVYKYHEPQGINFSSNDPQLLNLIKESTDKFLKGIGEEDDKDLSIVVKSMMVIQ